MADPPNHLHENVYNKWLQVNNMQYVLRPWRNQHTSYFVLQLVHYRGFRRTKPLRKGVLGPESVAKPFVRPVEGMAQKTGSPTIAAPQLHAKTSTVSPHLDLPTDRMSPVFDSSVQHKTLTWEATNHKSWHKAVQHYLMLSKIRLTSLVVMTSMAGYAMAPATFDLTMFALCSLGTGLLSCAANAVNQYHEVPFDAQMARTRNRVLVRGLLTPIHALGFAAVCAVSGLATLYWGVNSLTAVLGLTNLILYTSVYTPLKRVSILNTWVGSIVGGLPPLMGWAGCTGSLDTGAWVLAGLLYAWQFPHFNALSWNLRPDYSRAGYRMMSVTDPGLCRRTTLRYTVAIVALSCSAPFLEVTNTLFALESAPLNAYFTYLAWQFYKESDSSSSRRLFRFSLVHLPILMLLLLVNKKHWGPSTDGEIDEGSLETQLPVATALPVVDTRQLGLSLVTPQRH